MIARLIEENPLDLLPPFLVNLLIRLELLEPWNKFTADLPTDVRQLPFQFPQLLRLLLDRQHFVFLKSILASINQSIHPSSKQASS